MEHVIICASKYYDVLKMQSLYQKGIKHFGENRVDDLLIKQSSLEKYDITWHFIGHLQRNKVKKVINHIDYLHSLDSLELAKEIEKYRSDSLKCFVQINATDESQKNGINPRDLEFFLSELKEFKKIDVIGLMTIGKDNDEAATDDAFSMTYKLSRMFNLPNLSMGMSNDYEIALKYQANYLRIGSSIDKFVQE